MTEITPRPTPTEQSLDDVLAQYIAGEEVGDTPNRQEFLRQHPQHAAELREFFANRDQMQRLAEPLRGNDAPTRDRATLGNVRYFGDYELLEEVAAGGMGIVYKARQLSLNRIVAVKMILKGTLAREEDVRRFRAEAEAAASLQHPAIVAIHEVGLHEGQHYFSMDFVEGHSLAELPREQPLSARQAAEYVRDSAEAVHYAHQQGTLHRDLKPSNILIDRQGRVRITDFGLAKRIEGNSDLTLTGQILGTPSYMPPEQASGKRSLVAAASDIYSLGAVLYELLTGRSPFRGESPAETLRQVESLDPVSPRLLNPATPRDLETICLKCLEKEPHKRYGTAQLLADDLGRYLHGEPIVARPIRTWQRAVKWVRRHPTAACLAVMSSVALLAVVGLVVGQSYNTRLKTLNDELSNAKVSLEGQNKQLSFAKANLETANTELVETSGKLAKALDDVKAERARARRYLYTAGMALAQRADQEKQAGRVAQILRSLIPERPDQEDLRDFEWHHLWRKYCGAETHLRGHASPVTSIAFSQDNKLIASGGEDGTLKLWDTATTKESRVLGDHKERITAIAFTPDSSRLICASAEKTLTLWDAATGEELRTFWGHEETITAIVFSPQGKYFCSGSDDGSVFVWEVNTGVRYAELKQEESIRGVAFDNEGKSLSIVTTGMLEIWKPFSNQSTTSVTKLSATTNVAFSPDANYLVSGNVPGNRVSLRTRTTPIKSTLTTWDCGKNERGIWLEIPGTIVSVAYSPDGNTFAAAVSEGGENTIRVWDKQTGTESCVHRDLSAIHSITYSPDGSQIAAGLGDGTIVLSTLPGRQTRALHGGQGRAASVAFGAGGQLLAANSEKGINVWKLSTGERIEQGDGGRDQRIAMSPTSGLLAGAPATNVVDVITGRRVDLAERKGIARGGPYGYAFSNDGSFLAEATGSAAIQVWETSDGQHVRTLSLDGYTASAAFSPDNRWIAGGSGSGSMQVWEIASGDVVSPKQVLPFGVWGLTFSPDGKLLAAATGLYGEHGPNINAVLIWNTKTWKVVHELRGHSECVWSVAFNPKGTRLASASSRYGTDSNRPGGEVKLWDVATGHEVLNITNEKGGMLAAAFSPDGTQLATAGQVGHVKLLDGTPSAIGPAYGPLQDDPLGRIAGAVEARLTEDTSVSRLPRSPDIKASNSAVSPGVNRSASTAFSAADQHSKAGRWHQAIIEYTNAIELQPDYLLAWGERGWAHLMLEQWAEGIADYREVVRQKRSPDALNRLAWLMATAPDPRLHEPEQAIKLVETAIQLSPTNASYWNTLGAARYRAGDWHSAIAALEESELISPQGRLFAYNAFFLSMAHWQLGDEEVARRWHNQAMEWIANNKVMLENHTRAKELRRLEAESAGLLGSAGAK